jgi:UDP-2-acetamido-2,6-beta-L-arabino-hexul-4-ose reductase
MIRVGITGQAGFIGTYLFNTLGLYNHIERVPFEDNYFNDKKLLCNFVKKCDVIVHLAAMNRHENPQVIYDTNILLTKRLIEAMEEEKVIPQIIFSSSTQEELDNLYGKSKREGRKLLEQWAKNWNASFVGLIIPNVFGEFSRPNYNTFIATFAHKFIQGEQPTIQVDGGIKLIYVASLCRFVIPLFEYKGISQMEVPFDFEKKVSEILFLFENFKDLYLSQGIIPELKDKNEINLFNTFRSFIDPEKIFPVKLSEHRDERGIFVETIKLGIGGQVSFSTTIPGITRGNHYHTRKIERFTVIKGKALIQLRKIGSSKVLNFYLNGDEPSYVDMPVWFTHNIKNIGEGELFTQFWINEWYNPEDADTYFETV